MRAFWKLRDAPMMMMLKKLLETTACLRLPAATQYK